MATIKSFTSVEQSKKLTEILPLESADMEYLAIKEDGKLVGSVPFVKEDDYEVEDSAYSHDYNRIACWSLAALLKLLPKSAQLEKGNVTELYRITLPVELEASDWYIDPIDACVAMIERLHELKML